MRGHALVGGLVAILVLAQATPRMGSSSPSSRALDQLTNSVTRPMPAVPPPTRQHPADVTVPYLIGPVPDPSVCPLEPGHWERRLSDRQHYVPPLTVTTPDGRVHTVPGGVVPPPDQRQGP